MISRIYLKLIYFVSLSCLIGCANVYGPRTLWNKTSGKTIAILPFEVSQIIRDLPEGVTVETLKQDEEWEGFKFQRDLYRYFLREMKSLEYPLDFIQDVNTTNLLLEQNNIHPKDYRKISYKQLAELLDVDGIIFGIVDQNLSTKGTFAGLFNGAMESDWKIEARFTLRDPKSGRLLWKYEDKAAGSAEVTAHDLSKEIMRRVPAKFPFDRYVYH